MTTSDARKRREADNAVMGSCSKPCEACVKDGLQKPGNFGGLQGPGVSHDVATDTLKGLAEPVGCVPTEPWPLGWPWLTPPGYEVETWTTLRHPEDEDDDPFDPVAEPYHYTRSGIEVWDAIRAWGLGYFTGCAVKYIARHEHKGNAVQDLEKAVAFLNKEIDYLRSKDSDMPTL